MSVTPLRALSIIISAVLAHIILRERLHIFGILGCVLCVVGSTIIILHAPQEREIESVAEVWDLATEPGFWKFALDTFNTAVISLIYYVMFTSLTILASVIMFKILAGTFLLHKTKDMVEGSVHSSVGLPKYADEDGFSFEGIPLRHQESFRSL